MYKKLKRLINVAKFLYNQRIKGFDVSLEPHFDAGSIDYFNTALKSCNQYLEWGTGGSTLVAAKLGKNFIAIDSDKYFLESVKKQIVKHGYANKNSQLLHYADIGVTKEWGQPIFQAKNKLRLKRWAKYSDIPINKKKPFLPDLILIDGRFRVACALKAIKYLHMKLDYTILVDDYESRTEYKEIERFANLMQLEGRMAVFKQKIDIDLIDLDKSIKKYTTDFR